MIRPPRHSEVQSRYGILRTPTTIWTDDHLNRYRWTDHLLYVGYPSADHLRAMADFMPDVEVVGMGSLVVREKRITAYPIDKLSTLVAGCKGLFNVVIDLVGHFPSLRSTLAIGGMYIGDHHSEGLKTAECLPPLYFYFQGDDDA